MSFDAFITQLVTLLLTFFGLSGFTFTGFTGFWQSLFG